MQRYLLILTIVGLLVSLPCFAMAAQEDPTRCPCWYAGYDAQKAGYDIEGDGPGGSKDECDLIGQKLEWEDGWYAADEDLPRKCPYKTD